MPERGRLVSLEGGEGVGKSTQTRALAEALRLRGHVVTVTREPGGSAGAEAIRRLLLEGEGDRWNPGAEALLFAAARADHVERLIRPALARGEWVVCDRFLDSSLAYQGGEGRIAVDDLLRLHEVGSGGLLPDRTLLLRMDDEAGLERALARDEKSDRIGGRDAGYHAQVAMTFDALQRNFPDRIRSVDASGARGEVTERLLAALADLP